MKILTTVENNTYDIDCKNDEIDDIRYCVFDGGDEDFVDFYSFNIFRKFSSLQFVCKLENIIYRCQWIGVFYCVMKILMV